MAKNRPVVAVRKRTALATAVIAVAALPSSCGSSSNDELSPATKRHAYAEAKDVCRERGLDRVATEYKSAHRRDAAARAYADKFLEPYRASVYRGCRAGLVPVAPDQVPCAQLGTRR